ncbi:hypothetical protein RCH06_000133 [Polaromonas sp. CG_9.5]|nr:hypothetical protein [Polaromonas sp. CG_9.5]
MWLADCMKVPSWRKSGNQEQSRISAFAFYRFMQWLAFLAALALFAFVDR